MNKLSSNKSALISGLLD